MSSTAISRHNIERHFQRALPFLVGCLSILVAVLLPVVISTYMQISTKDAQDILRGNVMKAIQKTNKHMMEEIGKTSQKRDREGPKGPKGGPGEEGVAGTGGEFGPYGPKGEPGLVGPAGSTGLNGTSGHIGPSGSPGSKGQQGSGAGEKGDPGPVGIKGERGASAPSLPAEPIEMKIPTARKGDTALYQVTCWGACNDIGISLRVASGDADLYAREGSPPTIQNSDCDSCPLCRSRSSQLTDHCERIDAFNGTFYAMVVAHKMFNDCQIIFSGMNLMNVTFVE